MARITSRFSLWLVFWLLVAAAVPIAVAAPISSFELKDDTLTIHTAGQILQVSLKSPALLLENENLVAGATPLRTAGTIADGQTLEVSYAPIPAGTSATMEVTLFLRWSEAESLLRKWGRIRFEGTQQGLLLKEVVLDKIDLQGRQAWTHGKHPEARQMILGPQSHPIFMPGMFVGLEFPVSSTRCEKGQIVLAHRPGVRLQPGVWYETRTAVYGAAPVGKETQAFQQYLAVHRPQPRGFHINYNSWWTSPIPRYTEGDILSLMGVLEQKLQRACGVALDSFCIDMGWSDVKSIWEIDAARFPQQFKCLQEATQKMGSNLGLWISPSSFYPDAVDGDWARARGFETQRQPTFRSLCLGGGRYADRFKTRLADLVGRYGMSHVKLDGYAVDCLETDHGHEPGDFSSEALAEGMIAAAQAARKANANVWLEATCFGWNPSPWWLFHVNSVVGTFGDDAPPGRVPAPVYRESYTTARDFFNLQGAYLSVIPANAQEVVGIIHQSPDPFLNDAVVTIMRGHLFLPLYVNPQFMTDARWSLLARTLTWARNNAEILKQTVPLLPVPWQHGEVPRFTDDATMPREPYGYAHVQGKKGLVMLRNPWIAPQSYALLLDENLGFSPNTEDLSAVSLYPEPRLYGEKLKFGDILHVALAPYETVVLALDALQQRDGVPRASSAAGTYVRVGAHKHRLRRIAFQESGPPLGPDWTCLLGDASSVLRLSCDANIQVDAPQAELLILCEGEKAPAMLPGRLTVNGHEVQMRPISSAAGWTSSGLPHHEHWTFLSAPLASGTNAISLDQFVGADCSQVSAWVWATKPGGVSTHPNALPQPESISLGGAAIFTPVDAVGIPVEAARIARPVDRIDGVYLDTVEPASVSQGWGTLQKNQSVGQQPMRIGNRTFPRGLGTHAPSKIVFSLDGNYRRFQAWAGPDANTLPTVVFEVWVDGVRRWQSGLMTRESSAAWIDLDVSGARTIELVVTDAGSFLSDHADWAEARLLR